LFRVQNAGSLSGKIVHKAYSFIRPLSHKKGASASPKSRHPKYGFCWGCANKPFYYSHNQI
jgi:hypothetical protein